MTETIKLDIKSWNIKQKDRSKGRMKFQIKLNKSESESFKVFTGTVKPKRSEKSRY